MPRTIVATDKLPDFALSLYEKVRGDFQATNALKIRMGIPVQLVGEELLHFTAAVDTRRQADGMDNDQINVCLGWSRAKVG